MEYEITVLEEQRSIEMPAEDCEIVVPGEWRFIEVPGHGADRE